MDIVLLRWIHKTNGLQTYLQGRFIPNNYVIVGADIFILDK